jgi:deoxyribodipyrimidine photo-lyase
MKPGANIFIFRRDLRIEDNLSFHSLIKHSGNNNILPIFIFNPKQIYAKNNEYYSNNAVQFMIESLKFLEESLHINYYEGDDIDILEKLNKQYAIKTLAFNTDYTPFAIRRDKLITDWCKIHAITCITEQDYTLFQLGSILNNSGKPYQVFTPFYKASLKHIVDKPLTKLAKINCIVHIKMFDIRKYYTQNPNIAVHGGRKEALKRLKKNMQKYNSIRDYPSLEGTTKLSAYIKFGCVSIREVFHNYSTNKALQRELIWREFYANILYHFPDVLGKSFKAKYDKIKWTNNKEWFKKWCTGSTGFAIVDAGMRQLNETGWMHNRVRMIVAMFLTKDLLIDWRWGEKYFASKLVDYDPASNNGGWQWSASTGTDSQPYFRIFNPDLQLKKYDKNLEYVKKWNPEYENRTPIVKHNERVKIAIEAFKKVV